MRPTGRLAVKWRRLLVRLPHPLRRNPLFDAAWYVGQYPDVRGGRMPPYVHYWRHGIAEARDPNRLFDTDWYLKQYPDVLASGIDPLDHYYLFGALEGRDPGPGFNTDWYLRTNPDVRDSGVNPLLHFLRYGEAEKRAPLPRDGSQAQVPSPPPVAVPRPVPSAVPRPVPSGAPRPGPGGPPRPVPAARPAPGSRDAGRQQRVGAREVLLDLGMLVLLVLFAPVAIVSGIRRRVRRLGLRRGTRGTS